MAVPIKPAVNLAMSGIVQSTKNSFIMPWQVKALSKNIDKPTFCSK
jgi:hypothetical protein